VERCGIDREAFMAMVTESPLFGGAVFDGYGAMIGAQTYEPALFPVALGLKDAALVEEVARTAGAEVPLAAIVREHLAAALERGWGDEDWSVIAGVWAQ